MWQASKQGLHETYLTPGVKMLRLRQSSLVGMGSKSASCGHAGPYRVASSSPCQGSAGCVGMRRKAPDTTQHFVSLIYR